MYLIYFLPAGKKLCEAFLFIASLHGQQAHLLGSRRTAEALYQPRHAAGHRAYIQRQRDAGLSVYRQALRNSQHAPARAGYL